LPIPELSGPSRNQTYLHLQKVFSVRFIFANIFGMVNHSGCDYSLSKHFPNPKQRRPIMKISEGIEHFYNYQRLNVKKKYVAEP
jgi:hypothetical protein